MSKHNNQTIEPDEYLETMRDLMKKGFFIAKVTYTKEKWTYTVENKKKEKQTIIVMMPVSSSKE